MHTHPLRASNNGNGGEAATAAAIARALSVSDISRATATSTNTASLKSLMHDSISMLEETTKTLLRTMRFDLAFMASREEEARTVLGELESQYETIERDMNTKTRHEGRVDEEGNANNNNIVSTIDWVDHHHHHHEDGDETDIQEVPPIMIPTASGDHAPDRQTKRSSSLRCSRVDWGSSPIGESFIELYGDDSEHDEVMDNPKQHDQWSLFGNKKKTTKQTTESTTIKKWQGWGRLLFFGRGSKCKSDMTDTTIGTRTTEAPTPPREEFPAAITSSAVPSQTLPQYNFPGSDKESIGRASSADNSGNFPDKVGDRQHELMTSIRSDNLSALQLQLLGCDTAVSTLNQLLTCRQRDQIDLQYERASLQHRVFYQEKYFALEIDQLRRKLHHGKVERRRKSRILEDAREELKTSIKMEEQLREELDCARRELFMLKLQQIGKSDGHA